MSIFSYFALSLIIQTAGVSAEQLEATIESPLVYNAYLNSEESGTFTCVTNYSDDIRWLVNGSVHNAPIVRDTRGIKVYTMHLNRSQHSVIKIPAISNNQHIPTIKCRAYSFVGGFHFTDSLETAQFSVQGLLQMEANISYSSFNSTHNLIEWPEPVTLNITNVEPDIENYSICSNVTDAFECVNTTATHFTLAKYFLSIFINVSAWNIVGESSNAAQIVIEACKSTVPHIVPEYLLEVVIATEDLTTLAISFAIGDDHMDSKAKESSANSNDDEDCLFLYEIAIHRKNEWSPVSTFQLYGYHHSIVFQSHLTRNQLYTISIKRTTSSTCLSLNSVDFSTLDYHYSNFNVSIMEGSKILQISYHPAVNKAAHAIRTALLRQNETLLQRSFNSSEELCLTQPCSLYTSLDLSPLNDIQQFTLRLSVLTWEENSVKSNVYFQEITLATLTDNRTLERDGSAQTTIPIITGAIGGGVLGALVLGCLSVFILITIKRGIKQKDPTKCSEPHNLRYAGISNPLVTPNEAYSATLQISQNEAYETRLQELSNNAANEPHLYDEINLTPTVSNSEPVYAEIAEQLPKVRVL